jgi:hypothetical protein
MIRILALVALVWSVQSQSQAHLFNPAPGSPVTVGEGSGKLVLGDVNGDGRLDLVTCHLLRRLVTAQIGDGTGRFAAAAGSPIVLAYPPGDIKLGDVNSDGILDLGVTNSDRDSVDIFLGDGKGGFSLGAGSPFTASASVEFYTRSLQFLDINEDGKLDIVTANHRRNDFATLLGNGRGGFTAGPATTFLSGQDHYAFDFGDINGDRHLDVVTVSGEKGFSSEPGLVTILYGDGKGAFKKTSEAPIAVASSGLRFITLADMNGDRRLDIVISHNSGQLSVLLNNGAGKFANAPAAPYDLGTSSYAVAVSDVNRDRRNDIVAATVDSVTVLLGGETGFVPAPGSPFRAGPGAYHLALGDIDGDGKPDVAASSFEGDSVTVLLGR